jgi:hypothetical protein
VNGVAFAVGGALGPLLTATPVDATIIAVHLVIAAVCLALLAFFVRGAAGQRHTAWSAATAAGADRAGEGH